jgi:LysR family transcriptional regulator for bpeEF and oprC
MRDLNNLSVFVKVAELRNLSEAARHLGITASAVSKAITRFEAELKVKLFTRSTRAIHLTGDGALFHERCKAILAQLDDAELALGQSQGAPRGMVRVQMPVGFGGRIILPALDEFRRRYPEVAFDIELSNRIVDMAFERIDVCVVLGAPADERVVAKKLCDVRHVACASPAYLERFGTPLHPDDLDHHHCLAYVVPHAGYREWKFARDGRHFSKQVSGKVNFNHGESLLDAAIAGEGIAMLTTYFTDEAVRAGQLRVVLEDWVAPAPAIYLAFLPNRNLSPRIRAFIDFLQEICERRSND